jgi:hypothetical protein
MCGTHGCGRYKNVNYGCINDDECVRNMKFAMKYANNQVSGIYSNRSVTGALLVTYGIINNIAFAITHSFTACPV